MLRLFKYALSRSSGKQSSKNIKTQSSAYGPPTIQDRLCQVFRAPDWKSAVAGSNPARGKLLMERQRQDRVAAYSVPPKQ